MSGSDKSTGTEDRAAVAARGCGGGDTEEVAAPRYKVINIL